MALSLGFLAMTVGGPAAAADRRDASRGAKRSIVRFEPSPPVPPPINTRLGVIEKGPPLSVTAALIRIAFTLRAGNRF
jgi:hypothetical protein